MGTTLSSAASGRQPSKMLAALLLVTQVETEIYYGSMETKGGPDLPFSFELTHNLEGSGSWSAFLLNGDERIEVPRVVMDGRELLLDMPHYDSRLVAEFVNERNLRGTWEKRRSASEVAKVPFTAYSGSRHTPMPGRDQSFEGRWRVHFETEETPAVAVFSGHDGDYWSGLRGTFLTSTGDYRYLSGPQLKGQFSLSCFDGAHAFLFTARLQPDGTLAGGFWSGNWHSEKWTAKRDDDAHLEDPFAQTSWNGATKLADLIFPDLDGKKRSLGDFAGKGTLLVVFGSWCPNCNDEAKVLKELDAKYRERGLRILGLAFELTGEPARDAEQVRIFAKRHELALPFFLCGTADKDEATKALGLVDRVRAFPTTIFVGADGLPKAIHSGFAGPATGEEHRKLRRDFEARIEALLR